MKQTIFPLNLPNTLQNVSALNPLIFPVNEIPEPRFSQGRRLKNINSFMTKQGKSMSSSSHIKGFLSGSPPRLSKFVYENGIPSFASDAGLVVLNPFIKQNSRTLRRPIKNKNKIPMKVSIGTLTEFNSLQTRILSNDFMNEDYASNLNSSELSTSRHFKKIEWKNKALLPETSNCSPKSRDHNNKNFKFDPNNSKTFQYYISNVLKDPFQPYRFSVNNEKVIMRASQSEQKMKLTTTDKLNDIQKPENTFLEIKHNPIHSFSGSKIENFKTIKSVSSNKKIFLKETTLTQGQKWLMEKQSILKMSTSRRPSTSIVKGSQIKRSTPGPNSGISVDDKIPFKNELIITKVIESKITHIR